MCGRFAVAEIPKPLLDELEITDVPDFQTRYNLAPSQVAPVALGRGSDGFRVEVFKWGLVPFWAKDPSIGNRLINARAETASEKPSFRDAFKKRRCLVPATGFYEWKKEADSKQPYLLRPVDGEGMAFAGLWERWTAPDGEELRTFTILTTAALGMIKDIHHRMPVIAPRKLWRPWLEKGGHVLEEMAGRTPGLEAVKVSRRVNNPCNDDPEIIEPVE